ncbi:MAG: valine--tRNA ligase [Candidatus Pacearchaeota archaeon]
MANQYDSKKTEEKIKNFWEKEKIFKFDFKRKGKIYSIDTPPPTVSGKMHIGHAYSYSQQDFVARFRRMNGNVFYPFGTDDNGLPTERLVERLNKIKSKNMERSEFIKICLKTLKEILPDFIEDWKRIGVSCDYDIYYSTIDDNSRKISQKGFIDLFKMNKIYKKKFPTIWCPECQTAIAQAELEDKEEKSLFSTLKFKVDGKDLLVATTRPELLGACVAVFVNPKDKKYKNLIGKKAKVPLFDFEVPIIADESADMEKGTGVLMICSYGDKFDVEAINRHKLSPRLVLNEKGEIKEGHHKGLRVREARKKILEELKNNHLITEQKEISHAVNVHDKCGCGIEFITTEQWFIKILDKKKELINQGKNIKWYPEYMFKRYENWVNGLDWDWSISRDRHFGIPIPVWNCECGEIILAKENELPVDPLQIKKKCPKCGKEAKGEKMVLDTWATSSLTPKIASSLVNEKIQIPFSLRPQAHDIIRTWAFYTIARALYHENKIPWENIMISGFVTLNGEKMSKSKGNVIDPREVLEKFGADELRFAAAGSTLGNDSDYQEKDLVTGKKLITKLWNASNFVFMNLKDYQGEKPKLENIDGLFLYKLNGLIKRTTESFENYEYSKAKQEVESFFWKAFCDNYLEIVKKRIYQNKKGKTSAQYVLYKSLLTISKLLAPIMPFITEEIYLENFKKTEKIKSIHLSEWPKADKAEKTEEFDLFVAILDMIRKEKTNNKKSMNSEIILTLEKGDYNLLKEMIEDLKDVSNAREIKTGKFNVEFV